MKKKKLFKVFIHPELLMDGKYYMNVIYLEGKHFFLFQTCMLKECEWQPTPSHTKKEPLPGNPFDIVSARSGESAREGQNNYIGRKECNQIDKYVDALNASRAKYDSIYYQMVYCWKMQCFRWISMRMFHATEQCFQIQMILILVQSSTVCFGDINYFWLNMYMPQRNISIIKWVRKKDQMRFFFSKEAKKNIFSLKSYKWI